MNAKIRPSFHKSRNSLRRFLLVWLSAFAAMLALTVSPAFADEAADYPDHVKDEIRAAKLEREARLIKLERELQTLRDSSLDAKVQRFERVRTLMQADKEMRDLLTEHPELYSLYRTALGQDAGPPPPAVPDFEGTDIDFCGCLDSVQVLWLGQDGQVGQAVLGLDDALYDARPGSKLGGSLCVMRDADGTSATVECRHPLQVEAMTRDVTMKRFHRVQSSEPVTESVTEPITDPVN